MAEEERVTGEDRAGGGTCPACGTLSKKIMASGMCPGCHTRAVVKARKEAERDAGVPPDLLAMRWVRENPGVSAEGLRKFWQDFCVRNQREFMAEWRAAEAEFAASRKAKDGSAEARADEGIERALELVDRWLEENEGEGASPDAVAG